jgi:hypothetical protein
MTTFPEVVSKSVFVIIRGLNGQVRLYALFPQEPLLSEKHVDVRHILVFFSAAKTILGNPIVFSISGHIHW